MPDKNNIPAHVAIIMDGNGRWAKSRRLPRTMGHNAGLKAMKEIVKHANVLGIKYLTVYAFSTENWKRSKEEVNGIFKLLISYVASELEELKENNVKVHILGRWTQMPDSVIESLSRLIEGTKSDTGLQLNIALNYGGRDEITMAAQKLAAAAVAGQILPEDISQEDISGALYTGQEGIPDPDLLIRTSGEMRISNYLLWQIAYSEMVFTDLYWPDFTPEALDKAIEEYQNRKRRFGGR